MAPFHRFMSAPFIRNNYPLPNLTFQDFWDLCAFIKGKKPDVQQITFTVLGGRGAIVMGDSDLEKIREKIEHSGDTVKKMVANFMELTPGTRTPTGSTKLQYRPEPNEGRPMGLEIFSNSLSRVLVFEIENFIEKRFSGGGGEDEITMVFGEPCEVLVADMDMRGFTVFCEQPHVESPYICAVMTAFYQVTKKCFGRFPADVTKFNGDGVLNIWKTTHKDRHVAVQSVLNGIIDIQKRWEVVRKSPHFSHGAPEKIGAGMAFGLASVLNFGQIDFIGRPINLAARLCSNCPGGLLYLDKSVPSVPPELVLEETAVTLKSFGEYKIWSVRRPE